MGLSRTVSEINRDLSQKSPNFPTRPPPHILCPRWRGNWVSVQGVKKLEWWGYQTVKKDLYLYPFRHTRFVQNISHGFPGLTRTFRGVFQVFPWPCMACRSTSILTWSTLPRETVTLTAGQYKYTGTTPLNIPNPFPLGLHALPLGLLDRACTQAGPTSWLQRRVAQHTFTHASLIN